MTSHWRFVEEREGTVEYQLTTATEVYRLSAWQDETWATLFGNGPNGEEHELADFVLDNREDIAARLTQIGVDEDEAQTLAAGVWDDLNARRPPRAPWRARLAARLRR
jgi:hypothetical protein